MSVMLLNSNLDLGLRLDGPLCWLLPAAAGPETVARLARLTRLDEAYIPRPAPYDPDNPSRTALYCHRCVFLNPEEVESPYWHAVWLAQGAELCEIHRLPLATLKGRLVRTSNNLPQLLKRVGRQELERRVLARQ